MDEIKTYLNKIIESGNKVIVDEENQSIKIFQGVKLKEDSNDSKYEPFFKSIKASATEIEDLKKNYHYKKALFNPIERGIVLIDVVDFSKYDDKCQAAVLHILNDAINISLDRIRRSSIKSERIFEKIISTGDGYYIIFNEELNATFFRTAIYFMSDLINIQKRHFEKIGTDIKESEIVRIRISCTLNTVDFFRDVLGSGNCYGIGLNEASRILSCGRKKAERKQNIFFRLFTGMRRKTDKTDTCNTIFIDETLINQATNFLNCLEKISPSLMAKIMPFGELKDKHGKKRFVWWIRDVPVTTINLFSMDQFC
jgi:hypothetical protein